MDSKRVRGVNGSSEKAYGQMSEFLTLLRALLKYIVSDCFAFQGYAKAIV
jgi:hypothetical protein